MQSRKEFAKKYREVIYKIATANGVDVSVGCDMLVSSIKGHAGMTYVAAGERVLYDEYEGIPEKFDYAGALSDWFSVIRG